MSGPSSREQVVCIHQVDERGGDRPVLGLAAVEEDVAARRDRDARGDVEMANRADVGGALALDVGRRDQEACLLLCRADTARVEDGREARR